MLTSTLRSRRTNLFSLPRYNICTSFAARTCSRMISHLDARYTIHSNLTVITNQSKISMIKTTKPCRFWWRRTGSNRRPEACKATALPTELRPLKTEQSNESKSFQRLCWSESRAPNLVGLGRLELPTSRLSGVRSNRTELQALFTASYHLIKLLKERLHDLSKLNSKAVYSTFLFFLSLERR